MDLGREPRTWIGIFLLISCNPEQVQKVRQHRTPEVPAAEQKDDSGYETIDAGKQVAGVNLILDIKNARNRCSFRAQNARQFEVLCQAVVEQSDGSELIPVGVAPGVALNWKVPVPLQGSMDEPLCQTSADRFQYICNISSKDPEQDLQVRIDLLAEQNQSPPSTASSTVTLRYSVGIVAGLVSTLPMVYQQGAEPSKGSGQFSLQNGLPLHGFQPRVFDLEKGSIFTPLNSLFFNSACSWDGVIYVSTMGHIYRIHNQMASIFAGAGQGDIPGITHRIRLSLGFDNPIACFKDGIYLADVYKNRVLKIYDDGRFETILGISGRQDPAQDGSTAALSPTGRISGMAVTKDGLLVFADETAGSIRMIDGTGKVQTLAAIPVAPAIVQIDEELLSNIENSMRSRPSTAKVSGLAISPSGQILVASHGQVFRLDPGPSGYSSPVLIVGSGSFGTVASGADALRTHTHHMRGVAFDGLGRPIVATETGLYRLEDGKILGLTGRPSASPSDPLADKRYRFLDRPFMTASDGVLVGVQSLSRDPVTGDLIIAELDSLRRFSPSTGQLHLITKRADGVPEDCTVERPADSMILGYAASITAKTTGELVFIAGSAEIASFVEKKGHVLPTVADGVPELYQLRISGEKGFIRRLSHCRDKNFSLSYDAKLLSLPNGDILVSSKGQILRLQSNGDFSVFADDFHLPTKTVAELVATIQSNPNSPGISPGLLAGILSQDRNAILAQIGTSVDAIIEGPAGDLAIDDQGYIYLSLTLGKPNEVFQDFNVPSLVQNYVGGGIRSLATLGTAKGLGVRLLRFSPDGKDVVEIYRTPGFTGYAIFEARDKIWENPFVLPMVGIDAFGKRLFLAVPWQHQVLMWQEGGISVVAGTGEIGDAGDRGPALSAEFQAPQQLTVGLQGEVYVADFGNRTIRVLTPTNANDGYRITALSEGKDALDCGTGRVAGEGQNLESLENRLRQGVDIICRGSPWAVQYWNGCQGAQGQQRIFVSQNFHGLSFNIVEIERPCPQPVP